MLLKNISSRKVLPVFDNDFYFLYNVYTQSFPPEERRNKEQLLEEILNIRANVSLILADSVCENSYDNRAGMFIHWDLDDFIYIGHFAVAARLRGQKIGETFLRKFLAGLDKPAILEVEKPLDTVAIHRIAFYKRMGFSLFSCNYIQPAYSADKPPVPLFLMETICGFLSEHYEYVRDKIYKEVYNAISTP
jgi:ribosomal protein S18 acetylase RimI-like enzyme